MKRKYYRYTKEYMTILTLRSKFKPAYGFKTTVEAKNFLKAICKRKKNKSKKAESR